MIRSFVADFSHLVQKHPSKVAVINRLSQKSRVFTYQNFSDLVQRVTAFYQEHRLRPGDIVLSLLPNSLEKFTCFFATALGGYGFNPIPVDISPLELENWLNVLQPHLTIIPESLNDKTLQVLKKHRNRIVSIPLDGNFEWLPPVGKNITR